MGFRRLLFAGLMAVSLLAGTAGSAHAACSNPAGNYGDMNYVEHYGLMQYCNGDVWRTWIKSAYNYEPGVVRFDGTYAYGTAASSPGVADGRTVTGSFWIRRDVTSATHTVFTKGTNAAPRFSISISNTGTMTLAGRDSVPNLYLNITTSTAPLNDTNWHHVIFSIDTANSGNTRIYVDGNNIAYAGTQTSTNPLQFSVATAALGATQNGSNKMNGHLADVWIDFGRYVDLTVAANRQLFRSSGGAAVFLGEDGSKPFLSPPDYFFSGPQENWHLNKGTAGGMTLADIVSAPSSRLLQKTGPAGCTAVGNVCADGTVYAGTTPDGNVHMFTTAANAPGTYTWNDGTASSSATPLAPCYGDTTVNDGVSCFQGQKNTDVLATSGLAEAPYAAAAYCAALSVHGYDDWYLPGAAELLVMYQNRVAIGAFGTGSFWSSSIAQFDTEARSLAFSDGNVYRGDKSGTANVRCVRKASCLSPYGRGGQLVYNTTARVLQYCDNSFPAWRGANRSNPGGPSGGCSNPTGVGADIVFNSATNSMQYCDGGAWREVLTADICSFGARYVGMTCADGSVYAGLSPDGNVPMYAMTADSSASIQWSATNTVNTALANCTTGAESVCNTGRANTTFLAPLSNADSPYHAAALCENLVALGRTDWYLPSTNELAVLYAARNAGLLSGTFTTGEYWASNEYDSIWAWFTPFNTGTATYGTKSSSPRRVRCVRR